MDSVRLKMSLYTFQFLLFYIQFKQHVELDIPFLKHKSNECTS